MTASPSVTIEVRMRAARVVIAIAVLLRRVIGFERARRIAAWAAVRLTRYRACTGASRGPWQHFSHEMREHLIYCWTSHWADANAADAADDAANTNSGEAP